MDLIHLLTWQYETLVKEQMLHEMFACSCHLCQIGRHREGGKEHLRQREWWTSIPSPDMSLACLVCHSVESPSHSFRSYSVSSSDNEGRCSAIANCLARRASLPAPTANSSIIRSSKVTPHPSIPNSSGIPGTPRLVRSCAVRRDIVRDWNFEEVVMEH
ncbi:hypothetical protein AAG906_008187 [Vitis piasezkii]